MDDCRVVDTNVLIVSSAADDGSPFEPNNTPVSTCELRQQVLNWLIGFEQDPNKKMVLDFQWLICGEYQNKLSDQDYGSLVWQAKQDRNEVTWISLEKDSDGHAILPVTLEHSITDLADRKIVAAVIAANQGGHNCKLTNACDTDWLDCADALIEHNIDVEQLIGEWLHQKWIEHRER